MGSEGDNRQRLSASLVARTKSSLQKHALLWLILPPMLDGRPRPLRVDLDQD